MSIANANRNSATSTSSHGHSYERFQAPQLLRPFNTISAGSLKSAADTSLGLFQIPASWGTVQVLDIGFHVAAATGVQSTDGTIKAVIGGVSVKDANLDVIECALPFGTSIRASVEQSLNRTTRETNLDDIPNYPFLRADEVLDIQVATQGVGAGTQSVHPYIIVRISPSNGYGEDELAATD
jgi:hypothetical protein